MMTDEMKQAMASLMVAMDRVLTCLNNHLPHTTEDTVAVRELGIALRTLRLVTERERGDHE